MRWLALAFGVGLLLWERPAAADDVHDLMARALEAQMEVDPPPAMLPLVSPVAVLVPASNVTPPGLARSAQAIAAQASKNARRLAMAMAKAARASSGPANAASDQASRARGRGRDRPGRGPKK